MNSRFTRNFFNLFECKISSFFKEISYIWICRKIPEILVKQKLFSIFQIDDHIHLIYKKKKKFFFEFIFYIRYSLNCLLSASFVDFYECFIIGEVLLNWLCTVISVLQAFLFKTHVKGIVKKKTLFEKKTKFQCSPC